jgi:hypothetical protein
MQHQCWQGRGTVVWPVTAGSCWQWSWQWIIEQQRAGEQCHKQHQHKPEWQQPDECQGVDRQLAQPKEVKLSPLMWQICCRDRRPASDPCQLMEVDVCGIAEYRHIHMGVDLCRLLHYGIV